MPIVKVGAAMGICLLAACSVTRADTVVSGVVEHCMDGRRFRFPRVAVYAFDASESQGLLALLRTVEEGPPPDPRDPVSVRRFFAAYDGLAEAIKSTANVAHTTTGQDGSFTFRAPSHVRRLVVFAYFEQPNEPSPEYTHVAVNTDGESAISIVLDFVPGICMERER